MSSLATMTLEQYLTRLASGDPTPGGGAAAALTAAQAAALLGMVVAVTGAAAFPTADLGARLDQEWRRCLAMATQDGVVFGAVMEAQKLPKSMPAEAAERTRRVQAALVGACSVPLGLLKSLDQLTGHLEVVTRGAKASIVSDAAVAADLIEAAARAAVHNVRINLKYIKDETFHDETLAEATLAEVAIKKRVEAVLKTAVARF